MQVVNSATEQPIAELEEGGLEGTDAALAGQDVRVIPFADEQDAIRIADDMP